MVSSSVSAIATNYMHVRFVTVLLCFSLNLNISFVITTLIPSSFIEMPCVLNFMSKDSSIVFKDYVWHVCVIKDKIKFGIALVAFFIVSIAMPFIFLTCVFQSFFSAVFQAKYWNTFLSDRDLLLNTLF